MPESSLAATAGLSLEGISLCQSESFAGCISPPGLPLLQKGGELLDLLDTVEQGAQTVTPVTWHDLGPWVGLQGGPRGGRRGRIGRRGWPGLLQLMAEEERGDESQNDQRKKEKD